MHVAPLSGLHKAYGGELTMWKAILWAVFTLSFLAGVSYAAQEALSSGKSPEEAAANDPPDPLKFSPVKLGMDTLVRAETTGNFSLGDFALTHGNNEGRILFRIRPSGARSSSTGAPSCSAPIRSTTGSPSTR